MIVKAKTKKGTSPLRKCLFLTVVVIGLGTQETQ